MTERVTTTKKKRRPTRVAPPKRPVTAAKPGVTTTPGSTVTERRRPCATGKPIPESKSPETFVTKRPSAPFRAEPQRAAAVRSDEGQHSVTALTAPVTVTGLDDRLERVLDRLFEGAVNAERFLYEELLAFVAGRFPDAFAAISRWLEEQVGPLDDDDDLEPEDGAESADAAGLDSRGPTGPADLYDGPRARERSTT